MLTDEDREKLAGCRVVASVSGGKDSAALSLWLTEQDIEHDRIFADTGWEHPATYDYLRGPLTDKLGPIVEVKSHLGGMVDLVKKKGMFPSRLRRFCTQELKVRPLSRHMKSLDFDCVNAVGIRAAESKARAKMPRWEWQQTFDCDVWRPLIDWSEQDVIDIHHRHGLAPNPLYLQGAERVGCWPCIFSRKREIALVDGLTPGRIDEIAELERELAEKVQAAAEQDGKQRVLPTFFHKKGHTADKKGPLPIAEAVEWSKTSRGGRQIMLLDTEPAGCVRWGLCEAQKDEDS